MLILGVAGNIFAGRPLWAKKTRKHLKKRKRQQLRRPAPVVITREPKPIIGKGRLRNFQLYALQLADGCYYVGMTAYTDARRRFDEHAEGKGKGAKWTELHRPIRIIETRQLGYLYENMAAQRENAMTVEYIIKHGVEFVRGGDMCYLQERRVRVKFEQHLNRMRNK